MRKVTGVVEYAAKHKQFRAGAVMSLTGWETYTPKPPPPRRRRGTLDERIVQADECRRESELQRAVEAMLVEIQARGRIKCWYHRSDTRRTRAEQPGFPDLAIGVRPGVMIGIELKTATGRLGPGQAEWLECLGERGAVCRSMGEVIEFLRKWEVVG